MAEEEMEVVAEIDRLPIDLLSHIFVLITSFKDLAQASSVSRKWRKGVKQSMGRREKLSFAGWKMDDDSTSRLVRLAYSLKDLDISKSRWGCQITDNGLNQLSTAKCISNLSSISLWGMTGITDNGVVQLISRASSLQHLNIGGTFIKDESLFAIARSCPHLKTIVLWGCRHVTESGLLVLVNNCRKLESINVWGMRVPPHCFIGLLSISPALQIQPKALLPNFEVGIRHDCASNEFTALGYLRPTMKVPPPGTAGPSLPEVLIQAGIIVVIKGRASSGKLYITGGNKVYSGGANIVTSRSLMVLQSPPCESYLSVSLCLLQ